jgi:hypothetical protein
MNLFSVILPNGNIATEGYKNDNQNNEEQRNY